MELERNLSWHCVGYFFLMEMDENIIIYGFYSNVRKAVSYAILYHKERKMFSVYTRGLSIDLRTGEEADSELVPEKAYMYSNRENQLIYFSCYDKAKACFDEMVRDCMEDNHCYPDMVVEELRKQGFELQPDWFYVNQELQKEESNFGIDGFSKN
jgi:hypothetical protein